MHRSSTRRNRSRKAAQGVPPEEVPGGVARPSTEKFERVEKSSRKSRPLSSSTNKSVPGTLADNATRLSSAPSEWKMGNLRSSGPADENDDWILSQQVPPLPLVGDKPRSRTRTCSGGVSKGKSEEKDTRNFASKDDAALVTQSGHNDRVPLKRRRNTDAQDRNARAEGTVLDKTLSLRRKLSWGRNRKTVQEPEETTYSRASQLGLHEFEKELVPSLRDTVFKMTGEQQTDNSKQLSHGDILANSGGRPGQSLSSTLSAPLAHGKPRSPRSPQSPLLMPVQQSTPEERAQYKRTSQVRLGRDKDTVNHVSSCDLVICEKSNDIPLAKPRSKHDQLDVQRDLSSSLKAPHPKKGYQNRSPTMNADDSSGETLRTPRMRSSPRVSPLLSTSTPPTKSPSCIPTPRHGQQSPSSRFRPNKSPSIPQQATGNAAGSLAGSLSLMLADGTTEAGRLRRPMNFRDPSPSQLRGRNDVDGERTPRANLVARYDVDQSSNRSDSSDERLRVTGSHVHAQDRFHPTLSRRAPFSANNANRQHELVHSRQEASAWMRKEFSESDCSVHETARVKTAWDDSHLRRKNELADLVAGLNLGFSSQNHPASGEYQAGVCYESEAQSDYTTDEKSVGLAMGDSHVTVDFREPGNSTKRNDLLPRGKRDSALRDNRDGPPSHLDNSRRRLSSTPNINFMIRDVPQENNYLRPVARDLQRDSLLMLNADIQRQAFGIPPSASSTHGEEMLSSGESSTSLKNQTLDSGWESAMNDGLELSHGAEQLFHALGIGAGAQHNDTQAQRNQRASWRSGMFEAERYVSRNMSPAPGVMSGSSSRSSIYEDDVPNRPWQKRDRDMDRIQDNDRTSSMKSSWRKTLSRPAYLALLERFGEAEMLRQEIIWELCETEHAFLRSLRTALRVFVSPLLGRNRQWISGLPSQISRLLDWLEDIFQLHGQINSALRRSRSSQYPVVLRIAETLRGFVPKLEVYQPYIARLDEVVGDIEHTMKDSKDELGEYFRIQSSNEECGGMSFCSFLWLPVTRLGRYLEYFNDLWNLTPPSHIDHLPTFSLLHSARMVIRVMREVKLREEEYIFVKELLSRIQGSPDLVHLVRRERRLVAHGALQRVHISERAKNMLEGASAAYGNTRPVVHFEAPHRSIRRMLRRRANSLDFCLSEGASTDSISSSASKLSISDDGLLNRNFRDRTSDMIHGGRTAAERQGNGTFSERTRTTSLYAFVFSDLAVFASIAPRCSPKVGGPNTLELIEEIGICRILSIADHSGKLGYDHLVGVHLLPIDIDQLDEGIHSDAAGTYLFFHLPNTGNATVHNQLDERQRWWAAFEHCRQFTLRSLSFPAHSGRYLACQLGADEDENTRQTVMGILASGLPLPKSPSLQIAELQKNAVEDAGMREREERGWWALRFQQVLHEMRRDDVPLNLQRPSLVPPPASKGKVVSERRKLKLVNEKKR